MRRAWWFTATSRTKARFARTVLGSLWLGLSNTLSIAALASVYAIVFRVKDFNHYIVFLGLGVVVWNSISTAIGSAPMLFEHNSNNVKNLNIHPVFYTLEEWAFQLQTTAQAFLFVFVFLAIFQRDILLNLIQYGWLPLLNLFIFIYWLPVIICILGAKYKDIYQLIPILLQLVFLLSPILYPKSNLGPIAWIADFNPFYRVLSPVREALMGQGISYSGLLVVFAMNILGMALALRMLTKVKAQLPFLI
jgi:lipopolysaccharide transport system permease protein